MGQQPPAPGIHGGEAGNSDEGQEPQGVASPAEAISATEAKAVVALTKEWEKTQEGEGHQPVPNDEGQARAADANNGAALRMLKQTMSCSTKGEAVALGLETHGDEEGSACEACRDAAAGSSGGAEAIPGTRGRAAHAETDNSRMLKSKGCGDLAHSDAERGESTGADSYAVMALRSLMQATGWG